jgi:integrase
MADAIRKIHGRGCATRRDARCDCQPSYQVQVPVDGHRVRRNFPTLDAAKAWRDDSRAAARRGELRARSAETVADAADALISGMRDGSVRTRSRHPYKPSVIRGYEQALRLYVLPDLGGLKLSDVRRRDVQELADRLEARGMNPSTVRNALMPLRVLYRRAVRNGDVSVNPTADLDLSAVEGRRERVASPTEAARLIAAVRASDRALWGCAFYAALRAGELRALDWRDVNLAKGVIRIEWAMDHKGEMITPKSKAGRRTVPIPGVLRDLLDAHKLATWDHGYVFGSTPTSPFTHSAVMRRARRAWTTAGLKPIGMHEARHTAASFFIAAGLNIKALTTFMGHSSVTVSLDRYAKLLPGGEDEAALLLDAFFERADSDARIRQVSGE